MIIKALEAWDKWQNIEELEVEQTETIWLTLLFRVSASPVFIFLQPAVLGRWRQEQRSGDQASVAARTQAAAPASLMPWLMQAWSMPAAGWPAANSRRVTWCPAHHIRWMAAWQDGSPWEHDAGPSQGAALAATTAADNHAAGQHERPICIPAATCISPYSRDSLQPAAYTAASIKSSLSAFCYHTFYRFLFIFVFVFNFVLIVFAKRN